MLYQIYLSVSVVECRDSRDNKDTSTPCRLYPSHTPHLLCNKFTMSSSVVIEDVTDQHEHKSVEETAGSEQKDTEVEQVS